MVCLMLALVTGSTGHIGPYVVRALLAAGHQVRAGVHGDATILAGLDVERVALDVRKRATLDRAMAGVDVVFHLAAFISVEPDDEVTMQAVNVDGVRNTAEAALAAGVARFVHVSSVHAYATWRLRSPLVESGARALGPEHPTYDRSKARGEPALRAVMAQGLHATIINPVGVVGPGDHRPSLMGGTMLQMYRKELPVLPKGGFCWVDVRDVADAAVAAMHLGAPGDNHLLSSGTLTPRDFHRHACEAGGGGAVLWLPNALLRPIPTVAQALGARRMLPPGFTSDALYALATQLEVDSSHARLRLGFSPRPMSRSVADAFAWWREHGVLT
ncbi:MAG: NAD-dependent epimerase/dehydratase family protein [Myxococcales bacterium]|nr:NAD-dependent epimerase/dehydratase family protein [Myxococcales bacterium]